MHAKLQCLEIASLYFSPHLSSYLNSSGPQYSTQGPLFVSSHPSLFLSFSPSSISLFLSLSPLLGSPQLRGPGAFRPDTHTRALTHTHRHRYGRTHTLTPANGRSRKCLIPVLEWCHYASLTGRLQDLSAQRESETGTQLIGEKSTNWKNETITFMSEHYVLVLSPDSW